MASSKIFGVCCALLLALGHCNFLAPKAQAESSVSVEAQAAHEALLDKQAQPLDVYSKLLEQGDFFNPFLDPARRLKVHQRAAAVQNGVNKVSYAANKVKSVAQFNGQKIKAVTGFFTEPSSQAARAYGEMNQGIYKTGVQEAQKVAKAAAQLQKMQASQAKQNVGASKRQMLKTKSVMKVQEKRNEARSTFNEPRASLGWKATMKRAARENKRDMTAVSKNSIAVQKTTQKLQANIAKASGDVMQAHTNAAKQTQEATDRTLSWDARSDKRTERVNKQSANIEQMMQKSSEKLNNKIEKQYTKMLKRDARNDKRTDFNDKVFSKIANTVVKRQFDKVVVKGGSKLLDVVEDEADKNADTRDKVDVTLGDFSAKVQKAAQNKANNAEQLQHNIAAAKLVNPSQVAATQKLAAASSAGVIPMAGSVLPGDIRTPLQSSAAVSAMQAVSGRAEAQRLQSVQKLATEQFKAESMRQAAIQAGQRAAEIDRIASEKRQKLMKGIVMQSGDLD